MPELGNTLGIISIIRSHHKMTLAPHAFSISEQFSLLRSDIVAITESQLAWEETRFFEAIVEVTM